MSQWGWTIAAVIAVVTLVQIVVFYYLIRNDREGSLWAFSGSESRAGTPSGRAGPTDGDQNGNHSRKQTHDHNRKHNYDERFDPRDQSRDEDLTRCSQCGTPNRSDSVFTFCRNCGAEL